MDALLTASQAMATRMYQEASSAQAAGAAGPSSDEEVVEAEIVDEGEDRP
jgi:hypothetical protein